MTAVTTPELGRTFPRPMSWLSRIAGIRAGDAAWAAPATLAVLGLASVLYLVNLTVSGYANTYYSAAALAGSQSWSAWFFGSVDPANFITIDKPPLGTMLIGLSVRLFGLSSWAILLPQALAGVATVGVLMATVRRTFGAPAAIIAGLVTALTPAAVLIFRYDNPDALLTLLLVVAAYALTRALEAGRLRWVILAATLVGFGFLTKYLQAYLVLPSFAVVWLVAAPGSLRRRIGGLLVALVTVLVASGWWVLIVELIPAASRPYIGGSSTNSVLDLLFGYDGLGRIFGQGGGAGGGPGGGGGFSGTPGLLRLFNSQFGGQVSWLLPAAIGSIAVGLWARGRAARTDSRRAAILLWGGWLAVHVVVFSFMSGIVHSYYVVAMAPAIGALVGIGAVELWRRRERSIAAGVALGGGILGSAVWAWALLERTPDFASGLGIAIVVVGGIVAIAVALPARLETRRASLVAAGLGLAILLAAPAAYAVDTMQTASSSGDPSAGPAVADQDGRGGFGGGGPQGGGAPGGNDTSIDDALTAYLVANRGSATWIVAVSGADQAGAIELSTGLPVMAMGGFSGGDPTPTLAQLKADVASGQLRYVLIGGRGGAGLERSSSVSDWVMSNGTVVASVGNGALYDLSGVATGT
jgi:4-amino-4-deoxy-L-arabinose transferase-like glycosyltransferase